MEFNATTAIEFFRHDLLVPVHFYSDGAGQAMDVDCTKNTRSQTARIVLASVPEGKRS
jgi:hypothetical protein